MAAKTKAPKRRAATDIELAQVLDAVYQQALQAAKDAGPAAYIEKICETEGHAHATIAQAHATLQIIAVFVKGLEI